MSDGEEDLGLVSRASAARHSCAQRLSACPWQPPMDTKFDCCICVDHLPQVDTAKKSKLEGVLRKIYGQLGTIKELHMPLSGEEGDPSAKS